MIYKISPNPSFPKRGREGGLFQRGEEFCPNPDLENETAFPTCHCEHLKGAWQSDEVVARG